MTVEVRELRTTAMRVRQFRRASGLSRRDLALKACVAPSTIRRIEEADVTGYNPHVATLANISVALGVKTGEIVNRGYMVAL